MLSHTISLVYQDQAHLYPRIHQLLANNRCVHWIGARLEAPTVIVIGLPRRLRLFMT